MAGLAANSSALLRPAHRIHAEKRGKSRSLRLVASAGQSEIENKVAVARQEVEETRQGASKDGAGMNGENSEIDLAREEQEQDRGDDEDHGRGPSVEEAKAMAKRQGQVESKIILARREKKVEAFTAPYRTKRWELTRNKGAAIADLMIMYGGLLDRGFGTGQVIAASGQVVIEKVRKDAKKLRGEDGVREIDILELLRAMELLEAELKLVKVAEKGEALFERLEEAKKQCKLAFSIASRI